MLFFIQNCLVEMGNTPSLRNIVIEKLCKSIARLFCNIVSPCTEGNKKLSLFIKRHISMHHGADSHSPYRSKFYIIFFLYIFYKRLIAIPDSAPDVFQTVSPDTVFISVFPLMSSRCYRFIFFIYKNSLDSCRTKFNTKCCFI